MTGTPFRAVITDDEQTAREAVVSLLADVSDIDVVGEARSGAETLEVVRSLRPDILFLDVQMPGMSGFEVIERLGADVPPGVVLVTAHAEFALRAFEVHAVDYVTKPFGKPRFMAAVERVVRRLRGDQALDHRVTLESLLEMLRLDGREGAQREDEAATVTASASPPGTTRRLGVRLGNRTTLVDVEEIDWIEADGDLARLHVGDKTHLLRSSLRELAESVGSGAFVRIHRSVLVNPRRIRTLQREPDGSGSVVLDSGVNLRVARARWEELERRLGLRGG